MTSEDAVPDVTNADIIKAYADVPQQFIEQVLEPQLDPAVAARHHAERYASVPGYLVIAATKSRA